MQPPPRKGKSLKTVHSEQIQKLQHKHQQEIELLEDLRVFSKQRAIIEKEYAQALCKLAQQYLSKRQFPVAAAEVKQPNFKTIHDVWKTVLEETERVGKVRVEAADTYMQQISEPAKPIKTAKAQMAKKVFEQINTLQKEVMLTVQDLNKSQKVYNEEEHVAHDARAKASEADSKVKNKSTGIFTSLAKLQQNSAKLNTRKEACETKSTTARNEYLINLATANAHLDRYYNTDLPGLIQTLDGEMFDKARDFFTLMSRTEVDCCGMTQECFMKILADSTMISRPFNLQYFLQENLVFNDKVQYQYEPQDNDQVGTVVTEYGAREHLEKEAKKWATKIARENRAIQQNNRQLNLLLNPSIDGTAKDKSESSQDGTTSPTTPVVDADTKAEELKQRIRRAETDKLKAEAKMEALRLGGIKVDEYIESAMAECPSVEEDEISQRSSSVSARSDVSGSRNSASVSESAGSCPVVRNSVSSAPNDSTYINYQEDDFEETFMTDTSQPAPNTSILAGRTLPVSCVALFDFQANNADELSIEENEALEVIGEGDGDGWFQAKNSKGAVGFVPQNYILLPGYTDSSADLDENEMNVDGDSIQNDAAAYDPASASALPDSTAPSSAGHDSTAPPSAGYDSTAPPSAGYDSTAPPSAGYDSTEPPSAPTSAGYDSTARSSASYDAVSAPTSNGDEVSASYSATDYEVQNAVHNTDVTRHFARALYDYEATCEEELAFLEGQLIHVIQKDENGIDDGWWKGELEGRVGVFPSLVVEEITQQAGMAPHDLASPDRPGPPAFTPPEPGPPPPHLEVTLPTPSDESGPSLASAANGLSNTNHYYTDYSGAYTNYYRQQMDSNHQFNNQCQQGNVESTV